MNGSASLTAIADVLVRVAFLAPPPSQQLDEMRRDLRWITDALQYARYKQPCGGVAITCLVDASVPEDKNDSTSSAMDYLPTPSPSPEKHRRKAISGESPEDGGRTGGGW